MSAIVQYYELATDRIEEGAIWCDGPKPGTKWLIPGRAGAQRYVLVRKARAREKHTGAWIEVHP